jgi:hypothetical protein
MEQAADAFNDILRSGFGTPEGGFTLPREGEGPTLFDLIVEVIRQHGPDRAEAGDNVSLALRWRGGATSSPPRFGQ